MRVREVDSESGCPRLEVIGRGARRLHQMRDEFLPIALLALKFADQLRLLEDHFGGDAHQFAELAHGVRRGSQPDGAADLPAHAKRQVDSGFDAGDPARRRFVDFDRGATRDRLLCAGVHVADARGLAARQDDAVVIHDVDVEADDAHGAFDDFLGEARFDGEHGVGEAVGSWRALCAGTKQGGFGMPIVGRTHDDKRIAGA